MSYWAETLQKNRLSEMSKNNERFQFLKYVDSSFDNITVIPPGTGMHKVILSLCLLLKAKEIKSFSNKKQWLKNPENQSNLVVIEN